MSITTQHARGEISFDWLCKYQIKVDKFYECCVYVVKNYKPFFLKKKKP